MKYPKKFKSKIDGLIVEFISKTSGWIVKEGSIPLSFTTNDYIKELAPHTDTEVWEEVNEMTELETLKQQVAEMQATIASMKQESKPEVKQWEPQGGEWFVTEDGDISEDASFTGSRLFGREYPTKEQAEWASKQMRKFNRLLCYIAEHTNGIPDDIHIETKLFQTTIDFMCTELVSKTLHNKIKSGEVVL